MKGLSAFCLLLAADSIYWLAKGKNVWTFHAGPHHVLVNIVSLVVAVIVGPTLWKGASVRGYREAMRHFEETGDDSDLARWDKTFR